MTKEAQGIGTRGQQASIWQLPLAHIPETVTGAGKNSAGVRPIVIVAVHRAPLAARRAPLAARRAPGRSTGAPEAAHRAP